MIECHFFKVNLKQNDILKLTFYFSILFSYRKPQKSKLQINREKKLRNFSSLKGPLEFLK